GGGFLFMPSDQDNDQQNGQYDSACESRDRDRELPGEIRVDRCAELGELGIVRIRECIDRAIESLPVRAVGIVVAPFARCGLADFVSQPDELGPEAAELL